ncbi:hypothetical protein ACHAWF_005924 [Thalassiosira exigua]
MGYLRSLPYLMLIRGTLLVLLGVGPGGMRMERAVLNSSTMAITSIPYYAEVKSEVVSCALSSCVFTFASTYIHDMTDLGIKMSALDWPTDDELCLHVTVQCFVITGSLEHLMKKQWTTPT